MTELERTKAAAMSFGSLDAGQRLQPSGGTAVRVQGGDVAVSWCFMRKNMMLGAGAGHRGRRRRRLWSSSRETGGARLSRALVSNPSLGGTPEAASQAVEEAPVLFEQYSVELAVSQRRLDNP